MRYTCCSNFRQGNACQASLSGSGGTFSLGAFLFAILLGPLSSIQQCLRQHIRGITLGIGFLDNPSLSLCKVSTCSSYRPPMRNNDRVTSFRLLVLRSL